MPKTVEVVVRYVVVLLQHLPVACNEVVVAVGQDLYCEVAHAALGSASQLEDKTLAQVVGANAGRVKSLEQLHHLLHLLGRTLHVLKQLQLVTQAVGGFAQQSVVVERPYDILHDVALLGCDVLFSHLLVELVVERRRVAPHHLTAVAVVVAVVGIGSSSLKGRRHLVVTAYALQGIVQGRGPLLAVLLSVKLLVVAVERIVINVVVVVAVIRMAVVAAVLYSVALVVVEQRVVRSVIHRLCIVR